MGEQIVIREAPEILDPVALLEELDTTSCGAVVSFLGLTRPTEGVSDVFYLEFDAWQSHLEPVLRTLAQSAIQTYGVSAVAMSHRVGKVLPHDAIVSIHVGSRHRKEAFAACSWLIDELKQQAPIWKKEVTSSGEVWKEGLG